MIAVIRKNDLSRCLFELPYRQRSGGRAIFANRALLAQQERKLKVKKGVFLSVGQDLIRPLAKR